MIKYIINDFLKYHLRTGILFRRYLKGLELSEKFSPQELEVLQNEKLRETIWIAYSGVPFYKKIFDERKLKPWDIKTIEDLGKLPVIDKKVVKENFKDFRNRNYRGLVFKGLTSGTTGTPGVFLRDLRSINFENAAVWRSWQWGGKESGSKRATLRGEIICSIDKQEKPFWRNDYFSGELLLSSYHLGEKNLSYYIDVIKKYQPFDLYAYPSTAYLLAEFNVRHNGGLKFNAVFTSSEMVFDYQREMIERSFGCKVFDWYGQAERVTALAQCEYGTYHELPDYSIVEYLPLGNNEYEVVGTTLFNSVMPLIRYRTGDTVTIDPNQTCKCKRNFRVINRINGRSGAAIVTPASTSIGILNHIPRGVNNLIELQFVQNSLHKVTLRIVCTKGFSDDNAKKLINNAKEHISKKMEFVIEKVPRIERNKNGKFIPVISLISQDKG